MGTPVDPCPNSPALRKYGLVEYSLQVKVALISFAEIVRSFPKSSGETLHRITNSATRNYCLVGDLIIECIESQVIT